jgi:hypothetical protein
MLLNQDFGTKVLAVQLLLSALLSFGDRCDRVQSRVQKSGSGGLALRKFTAAKGEALGTAYRPCNRRYSGVSSLPRRNVEVSVRSAPSHGTGNGQSYGVSEASEP